MSEEDRDLPPPKPTCAACLNLSTRKAAILCSKCGQRWHATCAKLTVAQTRSLTVWHCNPCRGRPIATVALPQKPQSQPTAPKSDAGLPTPVQSLSSRIAQLRDQGGVIRRIPKSARITVANYLSSLIDNAIQRPSHDTWWNLLSFAFIGLRIPNHKSEQKPSAASSIKRQVQELEAGLQASPNSLPVTKHRTEQPLSTTEGGIAHRIRGKCADGDVRAALRILTSNEDFARPSEEILSLLQQKHPPAPEDERIPSPPIVDDPDPISATEEQVLSAIKTMPPGSSAGLDGIRPLHLRQLVGSDVAEPGRRLLASITRLTNLILAGRVPDCGRDALFGASLCALKKKDGGVRPIAIGSTFRRLAGRIAARYVSGIVGSELRPVQLGVGTPLGCEAAVHAARDFVTSAAENSEHPSVLVKVDVRNAFNTLRRDILLKTVKDRCPEVYPLMFQAYGTPSPLYFGEHPILSARGVQQGDPLGPVAFALSVDACARSMTSPLNIWYLDDATLAGPAEVVAADLQRLDSLLPKLGLSLNTKKCEFTTLGGTATCNHTTTAEVIRQAMPDITQTKLDDLKLLGSPLHYSGLPSTFEATSSMISRLCDRIRCLDRHTATFFLSHHVSAPRLQYLLRSTPSFLYSSGLRHIDETVRATLADITNVDIQGPAWLQAALPIRHGGLGVRSVERLSLPCYIASLNACSPLVASIAPGHSNVTCSAMLVMAVNEFQIWTGASLLPAESEAGTQRVWDDIASSCLKENLLKEANQVDRARLLAAAQPHTAAWLQAIPVPNLGLYLDPETVRIAIALRLGAPVCEPHACQHCGGLVDSLGHHGLSCKKSAGRIPRHAQINDLIKRGLSSAGIPSVLEPVGLDRGDGKRPDGLTTFPFSSGKCMAWDSTCSDTFAESALPKSALEPGTAARAAEARKRQKYSELSSQYIFAPLAVETSGVIGPTASKFVKKLGGMITASTGERLATAWIWQRISIAIARGNALSVTATAPSATSSTRAPQGRFQTHNGAASNRTPSASADSVAHRLAQPCLS